MQSTLLCQLLQYGLMYLTWYVGTHKVCSGVVVFFIFYILYFNHSVSLGCIFLLIAIEIVSWMIFLDFSLVLLCMSSAWFPSRESGHHVIVSKQHILNLEPEESKWPAQRLDKYIHIIL